MRAQEDAAAAASSTHKLGFFFLLSYIYISSFLFPLFSIFATPLRSPIVPFYTLFCSVPPLRSITYSFFSLFLFILFRSFFDFDFDFLSF